MNDFSPRIADLPLLSDAERGQLLRHGEATRAANAGQAPIDQGPGRRGSCFIIGIGTLLIQCAQMLLRHGLEVRAVISADSMVEEWADKTGVTRVSPASNWRSLLGNAPFDYLFSIVNMHVLPREILALPRRAAINYHDGPLPRYAGTYVTSWAIMQGEATHGVTWHLMGEGVDTGDILEQRTFTLDAAETAFTLNLKCYEAAAAAFADLLDGLARGELETKEQNLAERSFFSRFKRPSTIVSWLDPAQKIDALVRALDFGRYANPLGLPKLLVESDYLIIRRLDIQSSSPKAAPGTITAIASNSITIATGSGEVALCELATLEGAPLPIAEFAARYRLCVGYRFDAQKRAAHIAEFQASISRHERFWVERLATLRPLTLSHLAASRSSSAARYATRFMVFPDGAIGQRESRRDFVLACLAIYFARTIDAIYFDLGFRDRESQCEAEGFEALFAACVPLRIEIDAGRNFAEALQAIRAERQSVTAHKTYASDALVRYPVLRDSIAASKAALPVSVEYADALESPHPAGILHFVIAPEAWLCGYDQARLTVNAIESMLTQIDALMKAIITAPERPIAELAFISTIPRRPEFAPAPLSFAQQRMWFMDQLQPGNPAYNRPTHIHLRGALNIAVLENTLNEIVRRHEILRTSFLATDGQPVQAVASSLILSLPVIDLGSLPAHEQQVEVSRIVTEDAQHSFDLSRVPLLKVKLVRLRETEHLLVLTLHHSVFDGWSAGILIHELSTLYKALSAGEQPTLPELPIQFADFARWQRQRMQGGVLDAQLAHWKTKLSGQLPLLELATDRARPPAQTFRGARQHLSLPANVSASLKGLSQREGATLFMTLLAAFQALLHRYTGGDDIIVGVPIAGRNRLEVENLIGIFINTLALRTDLSGNPSFRQLLGRVRTTALEAYAHQELPFEKLVEELQPVRDLSRTPVFQVLFQLRNLPDESVDANEDLRMAEADFDSGSAKLDLALDIVNKPEGLSCVIEYNTDLFDAASIARLLNHYENLLRAILDNPNARLSELPLLTEVEQKQLLLDWNETYADYPQHATIASLFEAQVESTPDAIALIFKDEELTYAELNAKSNRLAHHLIVLGVGPEVLVGICAERSIEMIVALMAILKAGGAYLPLDPAYPKQRLASMLEDARIAVLVTSSKLAEDFAETSAKRVLLDDEQDSRYPETNPMPSVGADNLAYVIYTSGSTGKPKGVCIAHRALANLLQAMREHIAITEEDSLLAVTTLSFDIAALELYLPLIAGARLVLASRETAADGEALSECLADCRITLMQATPATWRLLIEAGWQGSGKLRVLCGGEALPRELADQLLARCASLSNLYGPTETTIWSSAERVRANQPISIGRPLANTEIYILDGALNPVPIGVPGELHIAGAGLARGYLNRPELTAEKFISHPFSDDPNARLYRTGDLARYLPDGNIEFLGRIDHQVKIRGFRIELGEIEAVLMQHRAVGEAVVIAREDARGDKTLVAYVVNREDVPPSELRSFLKDKLPEYMLPSAIVALDRLPISPNGKLDRKALPAPEYRSEESFVAPRTPNEQTLAAIWSDVLELEKIGIHDNFFDLGGNSLLATQIVSRIREALKIEVPLRALFEAPTVADLATGIQAMRAEERGSCAPPIVPVSRNRALPLSFPQLRFWFFDQLHPGSPVYNIPHALRTDGHLDIEALRKALNSVVARHESLRTSFAISANGEPHQVIVPWLDLPLPLIDLHELPEGERETKAAQQISEEGRRGFDLTRGPLLRACVLRLGAEEHVFLLAYHHTCGDYWSAAIFFRELAAFYGAFREGTSVSLPPLPIQYADFAHWQREWLQGDALEQLLAYWRRQLRGAPEVLQLPTDRPRPPVYTYAGSWQTLTLPNGLTQALMKLSRSEGASLFMVLLAAYQTLLAQFSGQEHMLVGAPSAGRNRAETENLIGVFINTLVLRADLSANPTFRELVRQTRETTLGAYAHQDLPFDLLVKELRPKRNPDRPVLVQTSFNWQNVVPMAAPKLPGLRLRPFDAADAGDANLDEAIEGRHSRAFLPHNQTVKFDLTLFMWSQLEEVHGGFEYNTDLFEAKTIEGLIAHYKILLEAVATNPDRRLADLPLLPGRHNRRSENMLDSPEQKVPPKLHNQASRKNRFIAIKPKAINAERLVKTAYLPPDAAIPLIIEPELDDVDLVEWAKINRGVLDAELLKHGALLFRGFRLRSAAEFERFIRAISGELLDYSYRSTPRTKVDGKIYTSTEYPAEQSIPLHNEMSYSRNCPMKIWFFSVQQATQGGETPIADSRKVYERLNPKIRQRFSDRKVMYVRNYGSGLDLSWQDVFQTTDKAELEAFCARAGMISEWIGSDRLRTRQVCQAVAQHPRTKEWVWFNQAHLFHISSLHSEARECLVEQFGETNLPRNAYYGDGSPIEDSILDEIRGVYAEVETAFPWRESDILMLDNMLVAHGRRPFSGPRKVLVGMAEAFGMGEGAI